MLFYSLLNFNLGRTDCEMPMMIMELYRLIPFLNQMGKTKFHPLNMKGTEVGKVLIAGLVNKINNNNKFTIELKSKLFRFVFKKNIFIILQRFS